MARLNKRMVLSMNQNIGIKTLLLHCNLMKRVYSFAIVCCFFVVIVPISFGQAGEGESFARNMITADERSGDIPKSAVDQFLSSIGKIEKSQFVRVPFAKMSNWRKNEFKKMIRQWLHNFPKENHRVDVILKAHDTQTLQYIVRLFIVLPLPIDDPQRLAARKQLEEVRIMVDRIARAKFEKWFRDTYPSLDSGFVFDIKEERSFVSINDEEDDLNPFQCYSLKESVFKNIKQSAENALAETAVSIRETDKESIPRLMKELDNAKEAEEREYVLNKIKDFTHHWLIDRFDRDISEKIDPLLFEFTKAVPKSVLSAYKNGYTKEIETFVDSKVLVDEKAMKKAFDVGWEITIEEMKKANEEYQKEWDMIVAEQKEKAQKEQVNNEPVYEVTKRSFSAGKIVLMVVVNTILIALLAVLLFRHFKNRREG